MNTLRTQVKRWIPNAVRRKAMKVTHRKLGRHPFADIMRFLDSTRRPIVFDVGANIGQTVQKVKMLLPDSQVHCFEPVPAAMDALVANTRKLHDVRLNNVAVGSQCGRLTLWENDHSHMSSFLEPGTTCWGSIVNKIPVEVCTLDQYCTDYDVPRIDLLKSDTQGFELEVLQGAERLMRENRIKMLYIEIILSDMYKNMPTIDEMLRYLGDMNFQLVSFYKCHHQGDFASWTDALFMNPDFLVERKADREPVVACDALAEGTQEQPLAGGIGIRNGIQ